LTTKKRKPGTSKRVYTSNVKINSMEPYTCYSKA
jgi:hypothetical protein